MHFGWRLTLLLGSAVSIRASGCGSAPSVATSSETEVTLNDSDRTYLYWLPPGYDGSTPTPLIFSFHGAGGSAAQQAKLDLLTTSDFNTDHILVYLESSETDSEMLWEVSPGVTSDDVGYTLEVLDNIQDEFCIDDSRIYATGMSQGGGMVNLLACNETSSNRFAAYAPVSGAYYYAEDDNGQCDEDNVTFSCSPGRDGIPILAFQGGADDVVSYDGGKRRGGCLPNVGHWISQWAVREGLNSDPTENQEITSSATKYIYGDGDEKGLVSFVYDGKNVGHVWPATVDEDGDTPGTASFNASSLIMDFFKEQQLPYVLCRLPIPLSPIANPVLGINTRPGIQPLPAHQQVLHRQLVHLLVLTRQTQKAVVLHSGPSVLPSFQVSSCFMPFSSRTSLMNISSVASI